MSSSVFFLVFSQLSIGGAVVLTIVPAYVWRGFFRAVGFLLLIVSTLSLLTAQSPFEESGITFSSMTKLVSDWSGRQYLFFLLFSILFLVYNVALQLQKEQLMRYSIRLCALTGSCALFSKAMSYLMPSTLLWESIVIPANFFLSSLSLGLVLDAMILGHWYLVEPKFTLVPLRRLSRLLLICLGIQSILFISNLILRPEAAESMLSPLSFSGICFWGRIGVGIVGTLLIMAATLYTLRDPAHRSATQAATGLLYVAVLFVLVGELFSKFFFLTTSVAL